MKSVDVVIAESGRMHPALTIQPASRAKDILDEIGLGEQYVLANVKGYPYAPEELVYEDIPDGGRLFAATRVEVGASPILSTLVEFIKFGLKCCEVRPDVSDVSMQQHPPRRSHKNTKRIRRSGPAGFEIVTKGNPYPSLFWYQHGWKKAGSNLYRGKFKSDLGEFEGKAEQFPSGRLDLFIQNPPKKLLQKHPHAHCFQANGAGWYFIHNNNEGYFDLSSAIMQIEQILQETSRL